MAINSGTLYGLSIALIFIGVFMIFAAFLLLFIAGFRGKVEARGGGAIIIGPFPIVFGTDKESIRAVLWLSLVLTILLFVFIIALHFLYSG
ncbi:MAG: DUF131 domain-containing protein [Candidatus Bathyarchaeia archaeon]